MIMPSESGTYDNGKWWVRASIRGNWKDRHVLIHDHPRGIYIAWAEFERNQQLIADQR
jgi:hypothetical protein